MNDNAATADTVPAAEAPEGQESAAALDEALAPLRGFQAAMAEFADYARMLGALDLDPGRGELALHLAATVEHVAVEAAALRGEIERLDRITSALVITISQMMGAGDVEASYALHVGSRCRFDAHQETPGDLRIHKTIEPLPDTATLARYAAEVQIEQRKAALAAGIRPAQKAGLGLRHSRG